jgi:KUP system potassium uptake protein
MTQDKQQDSSRQWALTLTALGVVFGDIGTSPLYALRECFSTHYNIPVTTDNVLGILSLIIWSLIFIVSIKYMLFILRADNKGEGGILALLALAVPPSKTSGGSKRWMIYVGMFGAALLCGDGIITPAISVLSAVEGLKVATPMFEPWIVLITVVILAGLFFMQSIGTARIGFVFGPIIVVYFITLALLGLPHLIHSPYILHSFNPYHGWMLFQNYGSQTFWAMGSVFLAVTGCEALYADMGHFGRKPIRMGWTYVVFPALVLNYLGQGALVLADPTAAVNPFFLMAPQWSLYPLVILVTMSTVIASQALISGVFSLTRQAVQLGFCPRLRVVHTSSSEIGQIFIPSMNWALMIASIWLVLEFRTSSNLVGAYGIAVAVTMLITTSMALVVAWRRWHWSTMTILVVGMPMMFIDGIYVGANIDKIPHGGWFPLLAAVIVFALMTTWKRGRRILGIRLRAQSEHFDDFVERGIDAEVTKVKGTAIFLTTDGAMIPPALARNLKHNKVIHSRVILLSIVTKEVPRISRADRIKLESFPNNLFRATAYFGFMEAPTIQEILEALGEKGLNIELRDATFFLGRETLIAAKRAGGMALWREHLFSFMSRNAYRATQFFQIPHDQVIEIGSQIEL